MEWCEIRRVPLSVLDSLTSAFVLICTSQFVLSVCYYLNISRLNKLLLGETLCECVCVPDGWISWCVTTLCMTWWAWLHTWLSSVLHGEYSTASHASSLISKVCAEFPPSCSASHTLSLLLFFKPGHFFEAAMTKRSVFRQEKARAAFNTRLTTGDLITKSFFFKSGELTTRSLELCLFWMYFPGFM